MAAEMLISNCTMTQSPISLPFRHAQTILISQAFVQFFTLNHLIDHRPHPVAKKSDLKYQNQTLGQVLSELYPTYYSSGETSRAMCSFI